MSLNFNCSNIKDWQTVCLDAEGQWSTRTSLIIFRTMFIGMPVIDEKNCEEFHRRSAMWDRMMGESRKLEFEDVQSYIGLRTNANQWTKAKFKSHLFEVLEREIK
jgi:hypothetical protein